MDLPGRHSALAAIAASPPSWAWRRKGPTSPRSAWTSAGLVAVRPYRLRDAVAPVENDDPGAPQARRRPGPGDPRLDLENRLVLRRRSTKGLWFYLKGPGLAPDPRRSPAQYNRGFDLHTQAATAPQARDPRRAASTSGPRTSSSEWASHADPASPYLLHPCQDPTTCPPSPEGLAPPRRSGLSRGPGSSGTRWSCS